MLQNKSNEIIHLNNTLTDLRENQKEIKNRIEGFESPIGKVTIGFNDLLRTFPFALLVGFLVIISLLIESMDIRRKLIKFNSNSIENNNSVKENDIVDVTPLWIDPKNNEQNKFIRCFILISPFILYIIFFDLTKNYWFNSFIQIFGIEKENIILSYLIVIFGIILFVYSYYKIYKEYKKNNIVC